MNLNGTIESCQEREGFFHVYCQIPFCWYRCPHCCFVSVFDRDDLTNLSLIPAYVKSLVHEIECYNFSDRALQSIVFGGGTPTLLNGSQAGMIVEAVLSKVGHLRTDPFCMSFETTPELATEAKLAEFRKVGFNRVSIGVQSFLDEDLKLIGRANKSRDAFAAIDNARSAGYDAINIDLLAGFPGSTFDKWVYNLETAFKLDTECICINTMIYDYDGAREYINGMEQRGHTIPSFDERVRMYDYALSQLRAHGYEKVSYALFCKPGFRYRYEVSGFEQTDKAVCAFGPWVVSHLDDRIYQSLPFIREYIRQPLFKTLSCTYRENVYQLIYGQLVCRGAVRRDVVEPLVGCTLEEAINESPKAQSLVSDLICRGYATLGSDGLIFKEDHIAVGLILLWGCREKTIQV